MSEYKQSGLRREGEGIRSDRGWEGDRIRCDTRRKEALPPPGPSEQGTIQYGASVHLKVYISHQQAVSKQKRSSEEVFKNLSIFFHLWQKRTSKNMYPFHISNVKITA